MTTILEEIGPAPDRTFRYADHPDGLIDLHLPATGSGPVLVLVHGGFWKQEYDRTHTRPLARALADQGWVVATIEYRRVGPGGGGGWPQTPTDVAAAITAAAGELGVARVVLTGHSAGGHLALVVGPTHDRVAHTVALAPVADLAMAAALDLGSGAVQRFLGDTAVETAEPAVGLADSTQITIVHGSHDEEVPLALSRQFCTRVPDAGLVEIDCGHYEPIDPSTAAFTAYAAVLAGYAAESSAPGAR